MKPCDGQFWHRPVRGPARQCVPPRTDILPPPQGPRTAPSLAKQMGSAGVQP